jgi:hypothetical protein
MACVGLEGLSHFVSGLKHTGKWLVVKVFERFWTEWELGTPRSGNKNVIRPTVAMTPPHIQIDGCFF